MRGNKKNRRVFALFFVPVFIVLIIIFNCQKSINTCPTEKVEYFSLFQDSLGACAVSCEKIFQPINILGIDGFANFKGCERTRISSYDVNTGNIIARMYAGKTDACMKIIGLSKMDLWLYDPHDDMLLAFDPRTLKLSEVNCLMQKKIPDLAMEYVLKKTFYDKRNDRIVLTRIDGALFFINPYSFVLQEVDAGYVLPLSCCVSGLLTDSVCYKTQMLFLKGGSRKRIFAGAGCPIDKNLLFLDAKFIACCIVEQDSLPVRGYYPLQVNSSDLFLFHRESQDALSSLRLTHIELNDDVSLQRQIFDVSLETVLADENNANKLDNAYSSSGRFDYSFSYVNSINKKMIVVLQLRMICVDLQTGAIIYDKRM